MTKPTYIYGLHTVAAILQERPQTVQQLFIQESRQDQRLQTILKLAKAANITILTLPKPKLDLLVDAAVHQGIIAELASQISYSETDLEELLDLLQTPAFLLILDGVQDPHNLGACLRSANAAGVDAVIAPKDKSVAMTPVVRKVASGAAEITPFIQVTNLARTLRGLKDRGILVYGASDDAETTLYQTDLKGPIALVLGAEGAGLRRLTRECCDGLVRIPMQGTVSSLNVSVAAGICLFEAVRQRQF